VSTPADTSARWVADDGGLVLGHCAACGEVHHYPRPVCPRCGTRGAGTVSSPGAGVVHSFTITRDRSGAAQHIPAVVTLDEGVTLLTEIVDADPETLAIGDRVAVVVTDGIPRFAPEGAR
jgi:uncharacterized protein